MEDYYFDEFLSVLDAYNQMHTPAKEEDITVDTDAADW